MIELIPWDTSLQLQTTEDVVLYLQACLNQAADDPGFISHAIGIVARSPLMAAHEGLRNEILREQNAGDAGTLRR